MGLRLERCIFAILLVPIISFDIAEAEDILLRINSSCYYDIYHPDWHSSYVVQWEGEDPGKFGCKVGFRGSGEKMNTYKVCVEAITFSIQGPGIIVQYETGKGPEKIEKTFTEYSHLPDPFCAKENEFLRIEVKRLTDVNSRDTVNTSSSYFTLNVTAQVIHSAQEEQSKHDNKTGFIIMAILIVIVPGVFVLLFMTLRKMHRDRQKRRERALYAQTEDRNEDTDIPQTTSLMTTDQPTEGNVQNGKQIDYERKNIYDEKNRDESSVLSTPTEFLTAEEQTRDHPIRVPPPSYSEILNFKEHNS